MYINVDMYPMQCRALYLYTQSSARIYKVLYGNDGPYACYI